MNKIKLSSFAALAVIAASVSCTKEKVSAPKAEEGDVRTLSVSVAQITDHSVAPASKLSSEGTTMKWTSTDKLAVIDSEGHVYKFDMTAISDDNTTAEFTCSTVPASAELVYAVYPYKSDYSASGSTLSLHLNSANQYDISAVSSATVIAGKIADGAVTMKHVCSFLKLNVPARRLVSSIYTSDCQQVIVRGTRIAGKMSVDFSGDDPVATAAEDAVDSSRVTVKTKTVEGVAYSRSGDVYVPVIPGTYSNISVELVYTDGHSAFTRSSSASNTFKRGQFKDLGSMGGPFVSAVSASGIVSGTTLSISGSATVWKYSGVSNGDYAFELFYKDSEASEWTEVSPDSITGDGNDVTFTKDVTVTAGNSYQVKAVVGAAGVDTESEVATASAAATHKVSVSLNAAVPEDYANFVYFDAPAADYRKFIAISSGEDAFPRAITKSANNDRSCKKWSGTAWADESYTTGLNNTQYYTGGTLTKDGFQFVFPNTTGIYTINNLADTTKTEFYHSYGAATTSTDHTCIRIVCPSGYTISKITLEKSASNSTFQWKIAKVTGSGNTTLLDTSTASPIEYSIPAANKAIDTDIVLIKNTNTSAFHRLTVEYEY